MSEEEVWFFLRGEETVGPFSKKILQQIHQGGQLAKETMVWREGMETWQSAGEVAELELVSSSSAIAEEPDPISETVVASAPPSSLATGGGPLTPLAPGEKGKLKMKVREETPAPTLGIPSPSSIGLNIKPIAPKKEVLGPSEGEEPPPSQDDEGRKKEPSVIRKLADRWFSSIVLVPLFLIVAGVMVFLYGKNFPNVLWFVWIAAAFAVIGAISMIGIHTFEGVARLLSWSFLAPPVVLFWPVIMRDKPFDMVTIAEWLFLGFCFLYFLTVRIGLTNYIIPAAARMAMMTGVLTLGFIWIVGTRPQTLPASWQWNKLVEEGAHVRLPGTIARIVGRPEWGSDVGFLRIGLGNGESQHGIESARLKSWRGKEYRLLIRTVGNLYFAAKLTMEDGVDPRKDPRAAMGKEWPLLFSKDEFEEKKPGDPESTGAKWTMRDKKTVVVVSASLKVNQVQDNRWSGTIDFKLPADKDGRSDHLPGTFEMQVKTDN